MRLRGSDPPRGPGHPSHTTRPRHGRMAPLDSSAPVLPPAPLAGDGPSILRKRGRPPLTAEAGRGPGSVTAPLSHAVATDGEWAVVGTPWLNGFRGGAHVLVRDGDTWREVQRLEPGDLGRHDHFGASVSIEGATIRVSAPWQDLFRGAEYVFRRTGERWVLQEKRHGDEPAHASPEGASAGQSPEAVSDASRAAIDVVRTTSGPPPAVRGAAGEAVEWVSATDAVVRRARRDQVGAGRSRRDPVQGPARRCPHRCRLQRRLALQR